MLIDTHAHLFWDSYKDDLHQVINRSLAAGVTTIINVGVDVNLSQKALNQIENELSKFNGITTYSTIGIHPHEAITYLDDVSIRKDIEELKQLYLSDTSTVVAVGECGLDFSSLSTKQEKQLQLQLFRAQIDLAKKLNLPLLIHCRDDRSMNAHNTETWDQVLEMTKDHFGIYHCYSGLESTTYKLQPTNFLVSFAANITYPKNEYLREAVKVLPLDRICFETDSPFLAPQSKRGQRNEPASVREIAELVTQIKGISLEKVAEQTTKNVKKLFKIN